MLVNSLQEQEGRQAHGRFQFIDGEPMREPTPDEHCNLKQRLGCRFPAETASDHGGRNCLLRNWWRGRALVSCGINPTMVPTMLVGIIYVDRAHQPVLILVRGIERWFDE